MPWTLLAVRWNLQMSSQNENLKALKNTQNYKINQFNWNTVHPWMLWLDSTLDCCCCSVAQSCPTLCNPIDWSTPGFPVLHYLPGFAQTHVHRVSDAIQPSHPLLPPSLPALNLSQHQGLFPWVSSSHQVAKVSELQHQSFQWIFMVDFL